MMRFPRRAWAELAVLAVLAVVGLALFADGTLDLAIAARWYDPAASQPWPASSTWWEGLLYEVGRWPGLLLAGAGALGLVAAVRWPAWRRHARVCAFLLLAVVIGPGLVVHHVLKDHWDRPRPREVVAFGGDRAFVPAWQMGTDSGKSFASGHGAIACAVALPWLCFAARRRRWAWVALVSGTGLGVAMGVARIAAGGHWASDIWWSAVVTWGIGWALWHCVLRGDDPGQCPPPRPAASPSSAA
jgi:lipid A 4'-phosphatase